MFNFLAFLASLLLVIKSANLSLRYSTQLAQSLRISTHLVGFLVIAVISILPEAFIAITSAIQDIPEFGLGTLFGSNVADLTLVFAIVTFFSFRGIKVKSTLLKTATPYIGVMSIPLIFGLNGSYSRLEGAFLILLGICYYFMLLKKERRELTMAQPRFSAKNTLFLLLSMAFLLLSAHLTVKYGIAIAQTLQVNPLLIGMFAVGLGTTLPELCFSIKAVRNKADGLALGDILGTVISDATIVVGLVAVIAPFSFPPRLIYVTGAFMLTATIFLFYLMRSNKELTRKEGLLLLAFYLCYVAVELLVSHG
ncbi:MAG: hypothetical protein Q8P95_01220 [bacterium]|nr:hypothetical protein [bacterium]